MPIPIAGIIFDQRITIDSGKTVYKKLCVCPQFIPLPLCLLGAGGGVFEVRGCAIQQISEASDLGVIGQPLVLGLQRGQGGGGFLARHSEVFVTQPPHQPSTSAGAEVPPPRASQSPISA
ncbi:hypothetical protein QWZ10_19515 [Paracoccus cavernae]|uniref:Uncharacterized protein n=1 Tax=Paracoccus cavernae TaxID=1571207 RepID=A0ABT8DBV3_9RHOB|nr:hypothetical protein [Paracoccus cavernae]